MENRYKTCTYCYTRQPFISFWKHKNNKDGYSNQCKDCMKKKAKEYRKTNRKEISAYNRKWRKEHKEEYKLYAKRWRKENPEKYQAQLRKDKKRNRQPYQIAHHRKTRLGYTNKKGEHITVYGIQKRDYTEYCEICRNQKRRLSYHHWDDAHLELGIWVCIPCHQIIHLYLDGTISNTISKYKTLKEAVMKAVLELEKELKC